MSESIKIRHVSTWLLLACGLWLVLLGLYFIFLRPSLLLEDTRFMGSSLEQVRALVPGLEGWLKRVFIVMGGFMAGAGVLTIYAARVVMPLRLSGASWIIAIAGVLTVALMVLVNFDLRSDFRWLLLVPVLVWLAGFVLYVARR